ncbi:glycosyltransferase family 2 protein [Candidatus Woesearchaeota archaeon]|nr:glycosyltransferase family 2 protein [Candidatus Woesearchaeota archaeon]
MKVSIIIVNYNGKDLLEKVIASIHNSKFRDYEVIVLDNASTDGSQDFIKKNYKNVNLVTNKTNLGYSGINSALKYCKGEYILFLNNDMEIEKDCIRNLIKVIDSDKGIAMVAPKLVNFFERECKSGGTWVSRAFYNGHIKDDGKNITKEIPYLGVGLIKKDFVGLFGYLFDDDYFIYAEDLDLGLRIRLTGKKVMFEPDAIAYHMHSVTTWKTGKHFSTFLMERNLLTTFFKIFSVKNIVLYLPYVLFGRLAAIIKDTLNFQFTTAFSRIKALFWILFNFSSISKKRMETQKFRKVNDSYIFQVFNEKYLFMPKFIV